MTRSGPVPSLVAGYLLVFALALPALPTRAALGDKLGGVQTAPSSMRESRSAAQSASAVAMQETRLADGSSIRQFVNAQGIVFAVAWSTRLKPDFAPMLGRYVAEFDAGAASAVHTPGIKRSVVVERGDLVVHSAGRLNAFVGRAWLKSQIPAGVSMDEIR